MAQQGKQLLLDLRDGIVRPSLCQRLLSSARKSGLRHALGRMQRSKFLTVAEGAVPGDRVNSAISSAAKPLPQSPHVSNLSAAPSSQPYYIGYQPNIESKYSLGKQIGSGGYGTVRLVVQRETGVEYACKSVQKRLDGDASEQKVQAHLEAIQTELDTLTKLKGSLNVVKLEDVFEDDTHVHIVMQYCKGGELHHRIGTRHYTESTVATFMKAVLRTLAQCHSHHILHRDIKPGNFMLLDDSDDSPLIAIDFGLATPYEPENLPRGDLGLEGTPWFMSPEVLNCKVTPACDVWSAGVMAHQLLTGRMPFDDKRNPCSPGLSAIWKSILSERVEFSKSYWSGISDEAKDFIQQLLERDPDKRATAKQALEHPWLQSKVRHTCRAKPLGRAVVKRIQRFAQGSLFKQSVLRDMAEQLLAQHGKSSAGSASKDADADPSFGSSSGNVGFVLEHLNVTGDRVGTEALKESLKTAGLQRMHASDLHRLVSMVDLDADGQVERSTLAASLINWRQVQQGNLANWLHIAHDAFNAIDRNRDGIITQAEIEEHMQFQLPPSQMEAAVRGALNEAQVAGMQGLDFNCFLNMLRVGSVDSLGMYDDRGSHSSGSTHSHSTSSLHLALHHSGSSGSLHKVGSYVKAILADELGSGKDSLRHTACANVAEQVPICAGAGAGQAPSRGGFPNQAPTGGGIANRAPARAVFRFDDHDTGGAKHMAPAAPQMPFWFEDHSTSDTVHAACGAPPIVFRFDDHGPRQATISARSTPQVQFQFNDRDTTGNTHVTCSMEEETVPVMVGVGSPDGSHGCRRDGNGSGGGAHPRGGNTCSRALYTKPGFQEIRMHGSSLYRNAAMLRAVQE